MARYRQTLALILLLLPILVSVITAFRVRDLPRNLQDSLKTEILKRQKVVQCFDCESDGVKVGQKHTSVKTESGTRYEELKRAVREKQQKISVKGSNPHSLKLVDDESEDEDKLSVVNGIPTHKVEVLKSSNVVKSDSHKISRTSNKRYVNSEEDDDDDDDDDDEDDISTSVKIKPTNAIKKHLPVSVETRKEPKFVKFYPDDDDDRDDDEDDDDENHYAPTKSTLPQSKRSDLKASRVISQNPTKTAESPKKGKVRNTHNDAEKDANENEDVKKTSILSHINKNKVPDMKANIQRAANKFNDDDEDDEENNEDDDDDDDDDTFMINPFSTHLTKTKLTDTKSKEKSSRESKSKDTIITKVVSKEYHNDDDDDDDDDDDNGDSEKGGFFSGIFGTVTKLTAELFEDSEEPPTKQSEEKYIEKELVNKKNELDKKKQSKPLEKLKDHADKPQPKKVSEPQTKKKEADFDKKESEKRIEPEKSVQNKPSNKPKEPKEKPEVKAEIKPVNKEPKTILKPPSDEKNLDKKVLQSKSKDEAPGVSSKKDKQPEKEPIKSKSDTKETKKSPEEIKKSVPKDIPKEPKEKHTNTLNEPLTSKPNTKETKKPIEEPKKSGVKEKVQEPAIPEAKPVTKENKEKTSNKEDKSTTTKESHLKDVNEALYRKNLLKSEFEDYYAFFPTFAPNFSRIHNPECRRHGQILLRQLRGTKLWALHMLDATAKIPSGVLQGNGIQLGDFDQCMACRARVQLDTGSVVKIQGKYCLARLDVKAEDPELDAPVHLAQAKNLIRSRIDDPGHFVPRFSTLSWGVCVPSACGPEDVEVIIKDAVKHYQHKSGVVLSVKVEEQDCQTDDGDWLDDWLELPTMLTLLLYTIIILLVLVATAKDFIVRRQSGLDQPAEGEDGESGDKEGGEEKDSDENKEQEEKQGDGGKKEVGIIDAFSLYHTLNKLLAPGTSEDIPCIHGVRAVATIALLVAHKFLPVAAMPYTNRVKLTEVVSSWWWSWARAGWMYTDCFLLLSGTLAAHRVSEDPAPRRLLSRYLRLTPALLAVVLFYAYIWDRIGSGPMWGSLVTKNAEVCQEGWWWNLYYVQNWFGFEEMCAPQTHQLALDMQLTVLGGVIVWLLQQEHWTTWLVMPFLHAIAAYSRYTTVQEHRLTLLAYHGVTVSQLYRTARLSYTSVLHRSTPYLVGLSLGLLLRKPGEYGTVVSIIGWVTAGTLWNLVWWAGIDSGSTTYHYSASFAAQYSALAPIASAVAVAWLIYAAHTGKPEFLSQLLSSWPLVVISRLSYALYLCQFIVFLTNAATVRFSTEFTILSLIDVQEISVILLSSTVLTLTFVIPMQSLHKIFTFSSKSEKSEVEEQNEQNNIETEKESEEQPEQQEDEPLIEEIAPMRGRQILVAHREVLEEIPEAELECELQREKDLADGLEEILEEEEDEEFGEEEIDNHFEEDDLEVIEEEEGGEDDIDFWEDREEYVPMRSYSRDDDRDSDDSERTNGRIGEQRSRFPR